MISKNHPKYEKFKRGSDGGDDPFNHKKFDSPHSHQTATIREKKKRITSETVLNKPSDLSLRKSKSIGAEKTPLPYIVEPTFDIDKLNVSEECKLILKGFAARHGEIELDNPSSWFPNDAFDVKPREKVDGNAAYQFFGPTVDRFINPPSEDHPKLKESKLFRHNYQVPKQISKKSLEQFLTTIETRSTQFLSEGNLYRLLQSEFSLVCLIKELREMVKALSVVENHEKMFKASLLYVFFGKILMPRFLAFFSKCKFKNEDAKSKFSEDLKTLFVNTIDTFYTVLNKAFNGALEYNQLLDQLMSEKLQKVPELGSYNSSSRK